MPDLVSFSDWGELVDAVNQKLSIILYEEVAPVAEEILAKHIKSDIYDAYTPKENGWVNHTTYTRRHVLEGSITTILEDENTILITSKASASPSIVKGWSFQNRHPGSFLELLEVGHMGIWHNGFPRPAVGNTQKEFKTSQKIKSVIKKGIKRDVGEFIEF